MPTAVPASSVYAGDAKAGDGGGGEQHELREDTRGHAQGRRAYADGPEPRNADATPFVIQAHDDLKHGRLNGRWQRLWGEKQRSPEKIDAAMNRIVWLWASCNIFGPFAMPTFISIIGTIWYSMAGPDSLSPGKIAVAFTFKQCCDIISDPMMACYLRHCKMHTIASISWIGALIQGIGLVLLFFPQEPLDAHYPYAQFIVSQLIFTIGDTLQGTPTNTLGTMLRTQGVLTPQRHEQGLQLTTAANVVGILLMGLFWYGGSQITKKIGLEWGEDKGVTGGNAPWANFIVAIILGTVHFLPNLFFTFTVKRFVNSGGASDGEQPRPTSCAEWIGEYSRMLTEGWNNHFFRQILGAWICDALAMTLMIKFSIWFVKYKVEPEMGVGCQAHSDPVNAKYVRDDGFNSEIDKWNMECTDIMVTCLGAFFAIIALVLGSFFWKWKVEQDRDEYGNTNVYKNWLLFNLSSALTNALFVFVDRGDSRSFMFFMLLNGVPLGGMFMMDIMLLYLIKSEAWLRRSEKPLQIADLATQLDLHTTKFGFLKSFMPKAVAVVAEALPLAILQIWWEDPTKECCVLSHEDFVLKDYRFDYRDVSLNHSKCTWFGPRPDTFNGTLACSNAGTYMPDLNISQNKYYSQQEEVRQVCSLFFFMLPFCLGLASFALKSGFGVTDTADVIMTKALEQGMPKPDREKDEDDGEESPSKSMITQEDAAKVRQIVDRFSKSLAGSAAPVHVEKIQDLVCELNDVVIERVPLEEAESASALQSLAALQRARPIKDRWVGWMVPTTHRRHFFKLPSYSDNFIGRMPGFVINRCSCAENLSSWLPSCVQQDINKRYPDGQPDGSKLKAFVVGYFLPFILMAYAVLFRFTVFYLRIVFTSCRSAMAPEVKVTEDAERAPQFFIGGVLGRRTEYFFAHDVLGLMGVHIYRTSAFSKRDEAAQTLYTQAPKVIQSWISAEMTRSAGETKKRRGGFFMRSPTLIHRMASHASSSFLSSGGRDDRASRLSAARRALLRRGRCSLRGDELLVWESDAQWAARRAGGAGAAGPTRGRVRARLYWHTWQIAGVAAFAVTVLVIAIAKKGGFTELADSAYSIFLAAPLFTATLCLCLTVFFTGLSHMPDLQGEQALRPFSVDDLFTLCITHFNDSGKSSERPLIFGGGTVRQYISKLRCALPQQEAPPPPGDSTRVHPQPAEAGALAPARPATSPTDVPSPPSVALPGDEEMQAVQSSSAPDLLPGQTGPPQATPPPRIVSPPPGPPALINAADTPTQPPRSPGDVPAAVFRPWAGADAGWKPGGSWERTIAAVIFVPTVRLAEAVDLLEPSHRMLDRAVEFAQGKNPSLRLHWSVADIAPDDDGTYPYRCFLYSVVGCDPLQRLPDNMADEQTAG